MKKKTKSGKKKKMGRPLSEVEKVRVNYYIPTDLRDKAVAHVEKNGMTSSGLITILLRDFFESDK